MPMSSFSYYNNLDTLSTPDYNPYLTTTTPSNDYSSPKKNLLPSINNPSYLVTSNPNSTIINLRSGSESTSGHTSAIPFIHPPSLSPTTNGDSNPCVAPASVFAPQQPSLGDYSKVIALGNGVHSHPSIPKLSPINHNTFPDFPPIQVGSLSTMNRGEGSSSRKRPLGNGSGEEIWAQDGSESEDGEGYENRNGQGSSSGGRGQARGKNGKAERRTKRKVGKACVYCRRSHMVCEGGRPCERCIKREIGHLCRNVTPPLLPSVASQSRSSETQKRHSFPDKASSHSPQKQSESSLRPTPQGHNSAPLLTSVVESTPTIVPDNTNYQIRSALPGSLYANTDYSPAWPLITDAMGSGRYVGDGTGPEYNIDPMAGSSSGGFEPNSLGLATSTWGGGNDAEFGILSDFLSSLVVPTSGPENGNSQPTLSASDFASALQQGDTPTPSRLGAFESNDAIDIKPSPSALLAASLGPEQTKAPDTLVLPGASKLDNYLLAAADQPTGPRASRLAQVIKAKYEAGLLKPYDYVKGYERMNKWMDSGRAAPQERSREASFTSPHSGAISQDVTIRAGISLESRRRILAAIAGFRPKFRQIARTLTDVDLVFVEEAMERLMLEYDRTLASIHTPSCIWRRTGEIQKANQEFAKLTGIPAAMFKNGQLCIYELMDEDSAVRYWEGYGKIAFDASQRSTYSTCTLKIPLSLTKGESSPGKGQGGLGLTLDDGLGVVGEKEEYREVRCCFSITIRRDAWGIPVAIMGQWIPI